MAARKPAPRKRTAPPAAPVVVAAPEAEIVEAAIAETTIVETTDETITAAPTEAAVETIIETNEDAAGATPGTHTHLEIEITMDKTFKTAEDFLSFGQANLEAFAQSGQIWAAGVQDIGKSFAGLAQAQFDQTVATWKALAGVKSFKDAIDLQSTLARTTVETAVAETGKLTDASFKLAEQAIAPLAARVTVAVEKFGRAA